MLNIKKEINERKGKIAAASNGTVSEGSMHD